MTDTNPEKLSRELFIYVVLGAFAFLAGIAVVMNVMSSDTGLEAKPTVTARVP
jgi:hypothetical protein